MPELIGLLLALALSNPYLAEFNALPADYHQQAWNDLVDHGEATRGLAYQDVRRSLTGRYSWAVPSAEAIDAIASRCKHVADFGAGTGYWSMLLTQRGVTVRAVDDWSWGKPERLWFPVEQGSYPWLDQFDSSWCLLMVWPPPGRMPREALEHWSGSTLIYVGEWQRGNGDVQFFYDLVDDFDAIQSVDLPRWWNRSDWLYIFKRRNTK